ncbi:MAG: hypothetical protein PSV16_04985 [Flavobacterium sp.]|nr:hypothetical protein [Flavobacterium sp.]
MKKIIKLSGIVLVAFVALLSCSKDESSAVANLEIHVPSQMAQDLKIEFEGIMKSSEFINKQAIYNELAVALRSSNTDENTLKSRSYFENWLKDNIQFTSFTNINDWFGFI